MGDIKLFVQSGDHLLEVPGESYAIEKALQNTIERNLQILFDVRFLASEYSTGKTHGGRIDTLGIDENSSPVILEYKRSSNDSVMTQGLYYLDWLLDHKAEFQLLVSKHLGQEEVERIDWATARVICIANQFSKYDEHAVKQMGRNIQLFQYKKFGKDMMSLQLVNTAVGSAIEEGQPPKKSRRADGGFVQKFSKLDQEQINWLEELKAFTIALGDDVREKQLKHYLAFARITNFLCIEAHPQTRTIVINVKLDPTSFNLETGFSRDVTNIGHLGTGNLEITISSKETLGKALEFVAKAYERN